MKAPAPDRARRGLLLRRQRPRRLGGGDRQPGRAGRPRCWCRAPATSPTAGPSRSRLTAASRVRTPYGRGPADRSGGGRGGAARRHARTRSAPSSSSTPTPRAARPSDLRGDPRGDRCRRPSGAVRRRRRRLARRGAVRDGRARRQRRRSARVAEGPDGAARARPSSPPTSARSRSRARNPAPRFYWDWQRRQQRACRTASSAARRRSPTRPGSRPRSALIAARRARPKCTRATRGSARAVHAAVDALERSRRAALLHAACRRRARCRSRRSRSAPGIDPEAVRTVARRALPGRRSPAASGPLAGRVFRIGHLGDVNEAMILGCLAGVEAALHVQGIPCGRDGVDAAVAALVEARSGQKGFSASAHVAVWPSE